MAEVNLRPVQPARKSDAPLGASVQPKTQVQKRIDGFTCVTQVPATSSPTFRQLGATPAARYSSPTSSAAWNQVCGTVAALTDLSATRPAIVSELEAQLREVLS